MKIKFDLRMQYRNAECGFLVLNPITLNANPSMWCEELTKTLTNAGLLADYLDVVKNIKITSDHYYGGSRIIAKYELDCHNIGHVERLFVLNQES